MPPRSDGPRSSGSRRAAIDIVVGTHALFQSGVEFQNLGLTVVDEQHRFGVHQRLALSEKGRHTDLLVMTATPIPRTLVLTHFGDMAVSVLREKPRGRQPIDTAVLSISEYARVIRGCRPASPRARRSSGSARWSRRARTLDVISAEDRFAELKKAFGDQVALVHGRLSAAAEAGGDGGLRSPARPSSWSPPR